MSGQFAPRSEDLVQKERNVDYFAAQFHVDSYVEKVVFGVNGLDRHVS